MARFYTYAEVLTPAHIQWEVHARGLGCGRELGLVVQEVVDRNGGRYETTMPMSDGIREQARIGAQVSGDEECDFTDAERGRLPRDEGPVDPAAIIHGPFDPANPRRILRASISG